MAFREIGDSVSTAARAAVEQKHPAQAPGQSLNTGAPMDLGQDNRINVADLQREFRVYPSVLFSYCEAKAEAERIYELVKQQCEELEAETYLRIKAGAEKVTEKHAESLVTVDAKVKEKKRQAIDARRDLETMKNYTESMRAKKDMLIQLGADSRKE